MNRDLLLWTSILAPPAAWFFALAANFALAPLPCAGPAEFVRPGVWLTALLIAAAAGVLAMRLKRTGPEDAQDAAAERVRSMAISGVVLSVGFLIVIVAQALPDFILWGCP